MRTSKLLIVRIRIVWTLIFNTINNLHIECHFLRVTPNTHLKLYLQKSLAWPFFTFILSAQLRNDLHIYVCFKIIFVFCLFIYFFYFCPWYVQYVLYLGQALGKQHHLVGLIHYYTKYTFDCISILFTRLAVLIIIRKGIIPTPLKSNIAVSSTLISFKNHHILSQFMLIWPLSPICFL